jgi:transposase
MPKKNRKTKGRHPKPPKTDRKEIPLGVRQSIVNSPRSSTDEALQWPGLNLTARTIRKIRQRAKDRAKTTRNGSTRGIPLADITNVVNAPRGRPPIRLTLAVELQIIEKVTRNREERRKSALQHLSELKLDLSEDSFKKALYRHRYSLKKTLYKCELTDAHRTTRKIVARQLLNIDLSRVIFIDAAAIRLHDEGPDKAWYKDGEEYHPDVRASLHKDFTDGQFFGAICLGKRQGPWHIFPPETDDEIEAAKQDLKARNAPIDRFATLEFEAMEETYKEKVEAGGPKRKGKAPSLEVYLRNNRIERGDRTKGGGVDWYRLSEGYLVPKLIPWYKELKKEGKAEGPLLAMDNAAPHSSKHTKYILDLHSVVRQLWPAQSPDMNPIEQIWKYIRNKIRHREVYPQNKEEMFKAWEEEWLAIPQRVIDYHISKILKRCQQVLDHDGDNSFHG